MDLLVATHNMGKVREFSQLLAGTDFTVISLGDVGLTHFDVEETGKTFADNAALKATSYARVSGRITLADDSGLVVDALDGQPGVYSARYGSPDLDDAGRRAYLLNEMRFIPEEKRSARFVCVIAIADPRSYDTYLVQGTCEGKILFEERHGGHGFGYDALFVPRGYEQSFAELEPEDKNRISHRGLAVAKLPEVLSQIPRDS